MTQRCWSELGVLIEWILKSWCHSMYGHCQCGTTIQCNVVPHYLRAYTDWSPDVAASIKDRNARLSKAPYTGVNIWCRFGQSNNNFLNKKCVWYFHAVFRHFRRNIYIFVLDIDLGKSSSWWSLCDHCFSPFRSDSCWLNYWWNLWFETYRSMGC